MRLHLKKILTWTNMSLMVIAMTANAETMFGFQKWGYNTPPITHLSKEPKFEIDKNIQRQLHCLARNVYYEAGSEPMAGQLAVAQVTVNRAHSSRYPNDLCAVIAQSDNLSGGRRVCQFSWYCDESKNKKRIINENHPSFLAAKRVFVEGYRIPKLHGVYFFHRHDIIIDPDWPYKFITQIGNHVFYKRVKSG